MSDVTDGGGCPNMEMTTIAAACVDVWVVEVVVMVDE